MSKTVLSALILGMLAAPLAAGNTLRISGGGFSIVLDEPEGWTADFRTARQIANFVLHKEGTTWRNADVVIYARLVERSEQETVESFVSRDVDRFEENCPLFEVSDRDLQTKGEHAFLSKTYDCTGGRYEVIAVTQVPRFFMVLVLSSMSRETVQASLPVFREILSSIAWVQHPPVPLLQR